ncbi:hypothetical protein OK016_19340 [Vibrio chagasii]|nr:hypothetical protein [Vibrio chagasii]
MVQRSLSPMARLQEPRRFQQDIRRRAIWLKRLSLMQRAANPESLVKDPTAAQRITINDDSGRDYYSRHQGCASHRRREHHLTRRHWTILRMAR